MYLLTDLQAYPANFFQNSIKTMSKTLICRMMSVEAGAAVRGEVSQ